jgi:threonine dehydrogenase-like Zn-dependent dehydrogenase
MIGLLSAGLLPLERVVTHTLPLDRWEEAFRLLQSRQAVKIILIP